MAFGYAAKSSGRPFAVGQKEKAVTRADFYNGTTNTTDLYYDPLIIGYSIIIFTRFPSWVLSIYPDAPILLQKNFAGFEGNNDIEISTADVQEGFSQNAYQIVQNIGAKSNNFSLKHLEYSGSPITSIYNLWVSGMRDPDTGIATYPQRFGMEYCAYNHTAELMYISLRPDANNYKCNIVEFASYWTACFPKKISMSNYNYTKASQTAPIEIDMPWSGVQHVGPGVDQCAYKLLRMYDNGRSFNIATAEDFAPKGNLDHVNGYTNADINVNMEAWSDKWGGSGNENAVFSGDRSEQAQGKHVNNRARGEGEDVTHLNPESRYFAETHTPVGASAVK